MINNITILDKVLNKDWWQKISRSKHLSGHCHRNSPFETDDSCGNCDGARCETCSTIVEPPHLEFGCTVDILEPIVYESIREQYPDLSEEEVKDLTSEFVYSDVNRYSYKGFHLVWPTDTQLKFNHLETYNEWVEAL